jgi:uncharacterized membrane protein YbhN (UPF0104 family)
VGRVVGDLKRQARRYGPLLVGVAVLSAAGIFVTRQGDDLGAWAAEIWRLITAVPLPYLIVACLLKAGEVVLNAVTWRNVLRAAYPDRPIPLRPVLGVVQGTLGIFAVIPPKFGGFAVLGLYRLAFPDLALTGLIATRMVQGITATVVGTALLLIVVMGVVSEQAAPWSTWFADQPLAAALVIGGFVLLGLLLFAYRSYLRSFGAELARAGAILRTPGRFAGLVVLPSLVAIALRWGVTATLLTAFAIPATLESLLLVNVSHGVARSFQVTPGGFGTLQAVDLVALQGFAPAAVVTAYSLTQAALLLLFNIAFGLVAMSWAFGWTATRTFLCRRGQERAPAPPTDQTPVPAERGTAPHVAIGELTRGRPRVAVAEGSGRGQR